MSTSSLGSILTRASGLMVARIAGAAMALLANVLIARGFGADDLGIFALVMAVASLLSVVLPLGFIPIGLMVVSQYRAAGDMASARTFAHQGYLNIIICTAIVSVLAFIAARIAAQFDHSLDVVSLFFVLLIAPPLAFMNLNASILNGRKLPFSAWLPDLVTKPLLTALGIWLVLQLVTDAGLPALLISVSLAYWITLGTQVFVVRRVHRVDQRKVTPNRKRWFATATPWIFITILSEYFVELHLLLAGLLVMPAEVAILHICFRLRMLAAFGLRALYGLILPDVYSSHASNDWAGFRRSLLLANGLAVGYTVAVSFGLYLVGYWILAMFGEEFTAGQSALVIVSLAMVVRAAFGPAPEVLAAHDYHMSSFWILSIGAAISAVIAILLVPQMGYTALALSYTVAYNVVAIGQWWWLKHKTGIDSSIFAGVRTYLSTRQKNLQAA